MNPSTNISREAAARLIGSSWCADADLEAVYENLGTGRPPLYGGEMFATPEEALSSAPAGFRVIPMPKTVRLPRGIPLAVPTDRTMETASTQVYLLRFGDLLDRGLRIERHRIEAVDYMPAPSWLKDRYDFVAAFVRFGGSEPMRVRIGHDADGYPFPDQAPHRQGQVGWTPCDDAMAFLTREEAAQRADEIAARLAAAANWRSRS